MHAFIVSSPPDLPLSPETFIVQPETSIGIDDIRSIQHFLSRKSTSATQRTIILNSAELMTLPAQHAFLKTLEEPPPNTQIYLVTTQPDLLLPTILSRCQQLASSTSPNLLDQSDPAHIELFQKLQSTNLAARLILIDEAKLDRDSSLTFLASLEHNLHTNIQSAPSPNLTLLYDLITTTRMYLKSNCNVRLTMDHFCLSLPKS